MIAVVLVGGEGTRLRPLTLTTPKQLLPVAEVPMIERVVNHLAGHGVTEVVLSLGYMAEGFRDVFPGDRASARAGNVPVRFEVEPEPLDTAGAIRFAASAAGIDQTFVAVNGDNLTDVDLSGLVGFHRAAGAEGTIHLCRVDDPSAFGVVVTGPGGQVERFVEKPPAGQAPADTVNAGTYVLEPTVLGRIPGGRRVSIEREIFPAMAGDGSLYALPSDAYWTDTGTPWLYLKAQLDLVSGARPGPPAPGAVHRGDGVWVLGEAVLDGTVDGPSLVGVAAFVQSGAHVAGSIVGSGARVHKGATVRGSVLLPGAAVRSGAVVEDSIVGGSAVIGEGARVTALTVVGHEVEVAPGTHLAGARVPDPE